MTSLSEKNKDAEIIIDLTQAHSACALTPDFFLQTKQYTELLKYISQTLAKIPNFKNKLNALSRVVGYERIHDVITVHGKRGSGKTTFLLSALSLLKNRESFKRFKERNIVPDFSADDLCVLNVMDPTLFACREHLLHAVLSQIRKKILELSQSHSLDGCRDASEVCRVEQWHQDLVKLAKGLKAVGESREDFIPSMTNSLRWEDPEFLLEADIDSIQHSMDLERGFHKLVNKALELVNKKAFILQPDEENKKVQMRNAPQTSKHHISTLTTQSKRPHVDIFS